MKLQPLTSSEEEIMLLIWNNGKMYFRDIMDAFPDPKPHHNTVSTFLKILVNKDYLTTEKQGRIYLYTDAVDYNNYKKFVTKNFLEQYFNNSGNDLLKLLVDEKLLTSKDFNQFFEVKTSVVPLTEPEIKESPIKSFIEEITSDKKSKKKEKDKKKKKKKK